MSDDIRLDIYPAQTLFEQGQSTPGQAVIEKRSVSGWTTASIRRSLESIPNTFQVTMTERYDDGKNVTNLSVKPGDRFECFIGEFLALSGYVNKYTASMSPGSHDFSISGRGKCQDLVDCAADWPQGQISGVSAFDVVSNICKAYAIGVRTTEDPGPSIPQINLMTGDLCADLIERICRYAGLLYYEQEDGTLLLAREGIYDSGADFIEGVNVQSATYSLSDNERFSTYEGFLIATQIYDDVGNAGYLKDFVADLDVTRKRIKKIVAETVGGQISANIITQRLLWELNRRNGRSYEVNLVCDSWRVSEGGALWQPNTKANVILPSLKIDSTLPGGKKWIIGEVVYNMNGSEGRTASIKLMPPGSFTVEPNQLYPVYQDLPTLNQ